MTPKRGALGVWTVIGVAAVVAGGCSSGPRAPDDPQAYERYVAEKREAKEQFFRDLGDPENPMKEIPTEVREHLLPLSYYTADQEFSVPAQLVVSADQPVFEMPTSKGLMRKERRVGVLSFTLKGQNLTLGAFVDDTTRNLSTLFVPFADLTSGTETYTAGRYLDLHRTVTGVYAIDFNDAYSPYCAYNATYDCPYPPASNRLDIAVTAGERVKPEAPAAGQSGE
jgi:uncharacterized protein (DUF1684 family)